MSEANSPAAVEKKFHKKPIMYQTISFTSPVLQQQTAENEFGVSSKTLGYLILIFTYIGFITSIYALVVSKFVPESGNELLDFIKRDEYYGVLVPLTVPVTLIAVIFNWMGMKFFRHN